MWWPVPVPQHKVYEEWIFLFWWLAPPMIGFLHYFCCKYDLPTFGRNFRNVGQNSKNNCHFYLASCEQWTNDQLDLQFVKDWKRQKNRKNQRADWLMMTMTDHFAFWWHKSLPNKNEGKKSRKCAEEWKRWKRMFFREINSNQEFLLENWFHAIFVFRESKRDSQQKYRSKYRVGFNLFDRLSFVCNIKCKFQDVLI